MNTSEILALSSLGVAGSALLLTFVRGQKTDTRAQAAINADHGRRLEDAERRLDEMEENLRLMAPKLDKIPEAIGKIEALDRLVTYRMDNSDKRQAEVSAKIDRLLDARLPH